MAIISTRQQEDDFEDSKAVEALTELLSEFSSGLIGNLPTSKVQAGTNLEDLLVNLRTLLEVQQAAAQAFYNDAMSLSQDNISLSIKYAETLGVLDSMMHVSYDEALDHATADLMDAFVGAGAAEVDQDGDLVFDSRIALGKGDLKPVLREAIVRWVDLKIQ